MPRLDKALSDAGVASRRELKDIIKAGRVTVDGQVVKKPEQKIAGTAALCVDGEPVTAGREAWLLLYKPAGYVTSAEDPRDSTVMELIPERYRRQGVMPVGRLDKQTEGLLLFTSDGQTAHYLISPKHQVEKVYYAEHDGTAGETDVAAFQEGLTLRDGSRCLPAKLEPLGPGRSRVTVCQGMYHQVRRMLASRGLTVRYLLREREAGLTLDGLEKGQWRLLTEEEIRALKP